MVGRKQIWDFLDKVEGRKVGSSYKNLQKELERQGYKCESKNQKFKCVKKFKVK